MNPKKAEMSNLTLKDAAVQAPTTRNFARSFQMADSGAAVWSDCFKH